MIKVYLCVGFSILFSLFYVFSFLLYQSEEIKGKVSMITKIAAFLFSLVGVRNAACYGVFNVRTIPYQPFIYKGFDWYGIFR